MADGMSARIVVTAAVIERDGRYLITRRQRGVHFEGLWEFPGGKCEAGEPKRTCLSRELDEELGVRARIGGEIFSTVHEYADRAVELHFYHCDIEGEPTPKLGQEVRWVPARELATLEFLPADEELVSRLASE